MTYYSVVFLGYVLAVVSFVIGKDDFGYEQKCHDSSLQGNWTTNKSLDSHARSMRNTEGKVYLRVTSTSTLLPSLSSIYGTLEIRDGISLGPGVRLFDLAGFHNHKINIIHLVDIKTMEKDMKQVTLNFNIASQMDFSELSFMDDAAVKLVQDAKNASDNIRNPIVNPNGCDFFSALKVYNDSTYIGRFVSSRCEFVMDVHLNQRKHRSYRTEIFPAVAMVFSFLYLISSVIQGYQSRGDPSAVHPIFVILLFYASIPILANSALIVYSRSVQGIEFDLWLSTLILVCARVILYVFWISFVSNENRSQYSTVRRILATFFILILTILGCALIPVGVLIFGSQFYTLFLNSFILPQALLGKPNSIHPAFICICATTNIWQFLYEFGCPVMLNVMHKHLAVVLFWILLQVALFFYLQYETTRHNNYDEIKDV